MTLRKISHILSSLLLTVLTVLPAPWLCAQTWTAGMSESHEPIVAFSIPAQVADAATVLVIGGLEGDAAGSNTTQIAYEAYANESEHFLNVIFIPAANPDGTALTFPPADTAYAGNWTAHSLWRWTGLHAPDAVIIMGADRYNLGAALAEDIMGLGSIPSFSLDSENELIDALLDRKFVSASIARTNLRQRLERSEQELAQGLATVYGQELSYLTYIPAMALIGRLRLGQVAEVESIVAPHLDAASTVEINNSLQIAGHLLYAELAERTGDARYLALARRVADLGFAADGSMLEAMPFHGDYSDAFFMATPLLAKVGKLTGETRYFDMALRHVEFLQAKLLRSDGLYNHWPLAEAAWGRGNAFVALGLALALSDIPPEHPAHARLLEIYQQLVSTLLQYLDVDGMWHNVINVPGSWAEMSATTMIATAIQRGVHEGWLEDFYQSVADQAWQGVLLHIDDDYGFVNVCESTPGQDSLQTYLNRKALTGRDDRAGGMLLMLATERLP
ncbi:MAG: glycoside hydrolase family 88 protein [Pseudomonadales bacterium]|nr:glycoside hydrolase family 88 protein [Pseudomonadales bacterium]